MDNDNYKRYSFRINLASDITDWWNIGVNTFLSTNDYSGASISLGELFEYFPLLSPYDESGELIVRPDGLRLNPLKIRMIEDLDKRNNLFGVFHSDIKLPFLEGFNYRLNYSLNSRINKQYQFDQWGYNLLGEGFKDNENFYDWTLDNIFTYVRAFDKHNVNLTFVYGVEKRQAEMTYSSARDFTAMELGYNALNLGNATLFSVSGNGWEETSLYSMGRAVYTYNDCSYKEIGILLKVYPKQFSF